MCTVLLPPGVNPIAANKYIISYQTSVRNYHYTLHNNTEERWSHNMTQFRQEFSSLFFQSLIWLFFFRMTHSLNASVRKSTCVHQISLRIIVILSTRNVRLRISSDFFHSGKSSIVSFTFLISLCLLMVFPISRNECVIVWLLSPEIWSL